MLYFALIALLIGAGASFILSKRITTRALGLLAALSAVLAALAVALDAAVSLALPALVLLETGDVRIALEPVVAEADRVPALLLLTGGALLLGVVATALAPTLREFGAIFGWATIALASGLIAVVQPAVSLLLPGAWATLTLAIYAMLRASGTLSRSERFPLLPFGGFLASLLLLVALLDIGARLAEQGQPAALALAAAVLAVLLFGVVPPLSGATEEIHAAPTAFGAFCYGLLLPLVALSWLLKLTGSLPVVDTSLANSLVFIGAVGMLGAAAAALRTHSLRVLLGWQAAAQSSLVLVAAGLADPTAALAGPALLSSLVVTTLLGSCAVTQLERVGGSDEFTQLDPSADLRAAGVLWALMIAAVLGLPPLWGFWGRLWLFDSLLALAPWAAALLVAAQLLLFFALLTPLGRFWSQAVTRVASTRPSRSPLSAGVMLAVVLLLLGLAPQLAWQFWLRLLPFAPPELPLVDGIQFPLLAAAILLIVVCWLLWRRPTAQREAPDPDSEPVVLAPDALAAAITPLAAVGKPSLLVQLLYEGLVALSKAMSYVLAPFEQRYYLLGVLVTLICVMLLMAL